MLQIGEVQGAYYTPLSFACFGRAQKRIAQQRIDSRMDLGRIVDIRKKVFTEVKVRLSYLPILSDLFTSLQEIRQSRLTDRRRQANIPSTICA